MCQLCYSEFDGGRRFRRYNSCNLAPWHTYKYACLKIWKFFAPTILAPLWHHLYPAAQFHLKPGSFPSVQHHLLMLHYAWPTVKETLHDARTGQGVGSSMQQLLDDVEFLFECAIPTVTTQTKL